MRALVVYESMFGNTAKVADAIAAGLAPFGDVTVENVGTAPSALPADLDLLVVGGPTHAFGLSRPGTRAAAERQGGAPESTRTGLREWLAGFTVTGTPPAAAAFDTRVRRPRLPGSAARKASRSLRRTGLPIVQPPSTFWVAGTPGPLVDGELSRAERWGTAVAKAHLDRRDGSVHGG